MNIKKIPASVLKDIRDRGLTDEQIERSTPEELFREFCEWNGLILWSVSLAHALDSLRAAAA